MLRVAVFALAFMACKFDTAVQSESVLPGADAGTGSGIPDAAEVDASGTEADGHTAQACMGIGGVDSPIVHLSQINGLSSGRYEFFLGLESFAGDVSIDEEGHAWLMVLNYLHDGENNAELVVMSDRLPLRSSAILGADESATEYWGHVAPALLSAFGAEQLRFFAQSSNHKRRIHFRTEDADLLDYFATGTGSSESVGEGFTGYSDHSSNLPANQNAEFEDEGDLAMTHFPFYRNGNNHWGIRGRGFRWEVDDFNQQRSNQPDTLHRVWVRSAGTCGDGVVEGTEQCDDGNQVAGDGCDCCVSG